MGVKGKPEINELSRTIMEEKSSLGNEGPKDVHQK
jgi:hypothetical protein